MSEDILTREIFPEDTDADVKTEPVITEGEEELTPPEDDVNESGENAEDDVNESEENAEYDEAQTVESLRAELDALRTELAEKRAAFERMSAEINEFSELFPTVAISGIPDSVWQSVRSGIPLAASYALYEKKTGIMLADAKRVNQKNSALSTGPLGRESASDFFSPDEVRAMSRDEVRKNYSKIMESMKKWN